LESLGVTLESLGATAGGTRPKLGAIWSSLGATSGITRMDRGRREIADIASSVTA